MGTWCSSQSPAVCGLPRDHCFVTVPKLTAWSYFKPGCHAVGYCGTENVWPSGNSLALLSVICYS
jgi:hypothetical protein